MNQDILSENLSKNKTKESKSLFSFKKASQLGIVASLISMGDGFTVIQTPRVRKSLDFSINNIPKKPSERQPVKMPNPKEVAISEIFNPLEQSALSNTLELNSLPHIKAIKNKLNPVIQKYHSKPNISNAYEHRMVGLDLECAIISDAVTLLELKLNQSKRTLLGETKLNQFIELLEQNIDDKRINFSEVMEKGAKLLNIQNIPDFSEAIHKNPRWKDNNILRTQLDLFVNRGNYYWVSCGNSNFSIYLQNPTQQKLKNFEQINCWEAMLYSLIRAGAIEKSDVADLYDPRYNYSQKLDNLSNAFRWDTSKQITDSNVLEKAALYNPYFIEMSGKGSKFYGGTDHDMICFPDSTDKMIQVLATGEYDGKPEKQTSLYSHWHKFTDSRLGIAKNDRIREFVYQMDLRIIPLSVFAKKFPKATPIDKGL